MKIFKLVPIQVEIDDNTIHFNAKDLPEAKIDDIIEVYHPETSGTRVLAQARVMRDDLQQAKETVSLSAAFVKAFNLKLHKDVCVNIVQPSDVALTLLEITFKEQYWGRADMWDFRNLLCGICVYRGQRLKCFGCQTASVDDLWADGERRTSGYVTADTLFTFRSLTGQVNIFLQMSSEMWTFDRYGYLHYEKATAFLSDLFRLWTEKGSNHDLTLTLFSRLFYDAASIDDFPEPMRASIMVDCRGRFYEDFYHVVVQNERCDEWNKSALLQVLTTLFENYESYVVGFHESEPPHQDPTKSKNYSWNVSTVRGLRPPPRTGRGIPRAWNSAASEGNMLEVLNLGLNVFEKYYIDRGFDRTSKTSIVVSPGVGVFEVDRSLANITKQRTTDCSISSDIVCLADQPHHAVPLFVFPAVDSAENNGTTFRYDDYSIPDWISHCFYTCQPQLHTHAIGDFMPQCGASTILAPRGPLFRTLTPPSLAPGLHSEIDYDRCDNRTFRPPVLHVKLMQKNSSISASSRKRLRKPRLTQNGAKTMLAEDKSVSSAMNIPLHRKQHDASVYLSDSYGGKESKSSVEWRPGSVKTPVSHRRCMPVFGPPLVNPFTEVKLHIKVTSNTRRWTHAFPMNPSGNAVQPHHQLTIRKISTAASSREASPAPATVMASRRESSLLGAELRVRHARTLFQRRTSESSSTSGAAVPFVSRFVVGSPRDPPSMLTSRPSVGWQESGLRRTESTSSVGGGAGNVATVVGSLTSSIGVWVNGIPRPSGSVSDSINTDVHGSYWAPASAANQEYTLELLTGMDWKSLAYPPSLPLTTDFFPDRRSLDNEYVTSNYTVIPEDMCIGLNLGGHRKAMTASFVYVQMILQRLAQGFQIVLPQQKMQHTQQNHPLMGIQRSLSTSRKSIANGTAGKLTQEIIMSAGRIYHMLTLCEPAVRVKSYNPRHPFPRMCYRYRYQFRVPDSPPGFYSSQTEFRWEPLELYRWNYVDQYLSTRGEDKSFTLNESLKYWRARLCLIHLINEGTARRLNVLNTSGPCDVFWLRNQYNQVLLVEGFLRFLETANKLKRIGPKIGFSRRDTLMNLVSLSSAQDPLSVFFNAVVDDGTEFLPNSPPGKVLMNPTGDKLTESVGAIAQLESLASPPEIDAVTLDERTQAAAQAFATGSDDWLHWLNEKLETTATSGSSTSPRRKHKWLSHNSDRADVIRSMLDPADGLSFIQSQPNAGCPSLPDNCFISAEAVLWSLRAVDGVTNLREAVAYMQKLLDDGCVRHASGRRTTKFIHGFYLYFVVLDRGPVGTFDPMLGYIPDTNFEWEWCEVEIGVHSSRAPPSFFQMFADDPPREPVSETGGDFPLRHKEVNLNADPLGITGREQWGVAHYHTFYNPDTAFELNVSWLVASGPVLGELILSWSRRAASNGLHVIAIPSRPFMLPFMLDADPLRTPIFVPLNLRCLDDNKTEMFMEFPEPTRADRLLLLQCSILDLFGFVRDRPRTPGQVAGVTDVWPQYVHCTGGIIITIPLLSHPPVPNSQQCNADEQIYRDYIACQCRYLGFGANVVPPGFLWAWNFVFNKRWRNLSTGDELLQDRMLSEFRRFCSGSDGRLQAHYRRAKAISDAYRRFNELRHMKTNGVETIDGVNVME